MIETLKFKISYFVWDDNELVMYLGGVGENTVNGSCDPK